MFSTKKLLKLSAQKYFRLNSLFYMFCFCGDRFLGWDLKVPFFIAGILPQLPFLLEVCDVFLVEINIWKAFAKIMRSTFKNQVESNIWKTFANQPFFWCWPCQQEPCQWETTFKKFNFCSLKSKCFCSGEIWHWESMEYFHKRIQLWFLPDSFSLPFQRYGKGSLSTIMVDWQ